MSTYFSLKVVASWIEDPHTNVDAEIIHHFSVAAQRGGLPWSSVRIEHHSEPFFVTLLKDCDDLFAEDPGWVAETPTLRIGSGVTYGLHLGFHFLQFATYHEVGHLIAADLERNGSIPYGSLNGSSNLLSREQQEAYFSQEIRIDKMALELSWGARQELAQSAYQFSGALLALIQGGKIRLQFPASAAREMARLEALYTMRLLGAEALVLSSKIRSLAVQTFSGAEDMGRHLDSLVRRYTADFTGEVPAPASQYPSANASP